MAPFFPLEINLSGACWIGGEVNWSERAPPPPTTQPMKNAEMSTKAAQEEVVKKN